MKILFYICIFSISFTLTLLSFGDFHTNKATNLPNIDRIVVHKSIRTLQLYANNKLIKTYKIALGRNPIGHKQQKGDSKTPEGLYYITHHNPRSSYHLSLGISYPNKQDTENAQKHNVSAGGDIMIHGLPNYAPFFWCFSQFKRLDARLYCRNKFRNRRNIYGGFRRYADRNFAINAFPCPFSVYLKNKIKYL